MSLDLLLRPVGTLDLLLYLFRHGKTGVSTILSDTGRNHDTLYASANRLRDLGFAYEDKQTGYPTYVYWGLTREGEAMARALGPVADLLAATTVSMESELERLDTANDPATIPRRLEILEVLADRDFSLGRWEAAEAKARRLVDLAHAAQDARREVQGRLGLGRILQKRDSHEEASRELGEALRLASSSGAEGLASEAEYLIGADLERQGLWSDALGRFESAAGRAARAQDLLRGARARQATARILARRGRYEESLALLRDIAAEYERLAEDDELPRVYVALGSTAHSLDRPAEALGWFEKGVDTARRTGDVRMEAYALAYASAHWIDARQFRKAETALKRAGSLFEDLGERMGLGAFELNTAQLASVQDRWSDAEAHFDSALAIARETANRFQEAWVLFNKGQMMKRRSRAAEARGLLTEAGRIFRDLGAESRAARCDEELRDLTT